MKRAVKTRKNVWPFGPSGQKLARMTRPASGGIAKHSKGRASASTSSAAGPVASGSYKGYKISRTPDGQYFSSLDRDSWYDTKAQVTAAINSYLKGHGRNPAKRKNPVDGAVEAYKEFHGHEPSEEITVVKKVHFHKHLSAAGKLKKLVIRGIDYKSTGRVVTLQKFGVALLAFNEKKNQLFVEGGDQRVNLADFGINPKRAHELETLGRVTSIDYHTNKSHLGEEGGEATYEHGFRMTNENGKHIIVKIARYPDLIYSVPDEQLLFSGGSYFIRAEGIDQ